MNTAARQIAVGAQHAASAPLPLERGGRDSGRGEAPWRMPDWMWPYLPFLKSAGPATDPATRRAEVERLINLQGSFALDDPRVSLRLQAWHEVLLLQRLHRAGLLLKPGTRNEEP